MKNFDWLQAFAMEQQEQPEPGVSADAAPQDEQGARRGIPGAHPGTV